jgi:hypothetical protein
MYNWILVAYYAATSVLSKIHSLLNYPYFCLSTYPPSRLPNHPPKYLCIQPTTYCSTLFIYGLFKQKLLWSKMAQTVVFRLAFWRCPVRISAGTHTSFTEVLRCFLHSSKPMPTLYFKSGDCRFPRHPF